MLDNRPTPIAASPISPEPCAKTIAAMKTAPVNNKNHQIL